MCTGAPPPQPSQQFGAQLLVSSRLGAERRGLDLIIRLSRRVTGETSCVDAPSADLQAGQKKVVKVEDRATIMQTLSSLTQIITKAPAGDQGGVEHQCPPDPRQQDQGPGPGKSSWTRELDLYKKGQAGEDTALLKIKYTQLQIEVQHHNANTNPATDRGGQAGSPGSGSGSLMRGRGRSGLGAWLPGAGRGGAPLHAVVDHRPRALEISGFSEAERVELLPHFAAAVHGVKLSSLLRLSWYQTSNHHDGRPTAVDAEPDDEEFPEESMCDDGLLQDDG
ncbi:hypothetical protein CRUP_001048 [Coryphaenoides rupestris]|nr:hypothetical protein CRUP_001048 [Coryphaenoides rupestris]